MDINRINAIIAYRDGSVSNYTSANDGQIIQLSKTDFSVTERELFSWPSFRTFLESIDSILLIQPIDVSHILDIAWSVVIEDETGKRVISGFAASGGPGSNSNFPYDPAIFPNFDAAIDDLAGEIATATASMQGVGVPSKVAGGSKYIVNDEITLTGGVFSTAAVLRVASVGTIAGQDETNYSVAEANGTFVGGTGYSIGNVNTMSDGSTITVDNVSTGAVTEFTVTTPSTSGLASSATITQSSTTGEGATGFTMTLDVNNQAVFGAVFKQVAETPVGGEYTTIPADPVAQGSTTGIGVGATFNMDWGLKAVTVTDGGEEYTSVPAVSFSGAGSALATVVAEAVTAITVLTPGSGYSTRATVTIAAP